MSTDDTRRSDGQGLSEEERAEASARALADDLCAGSTHPRDEEVGDFHCQECYDIACTVHDSPWLARILAARGGNTDNTLRAVYLTPSQVDDLRRWLGKAVDGGVSLHQEAANEGRRIVAALDAAPAPTECPSACGRNEPCADRWHDDQRRLAFPAARTDEPCIAPPGNLCTDTGCWDADRCIVRTAPTDNQRDDGLAERVRALADEWASEGDDLIRNCYSGRDVNEGEQLKSCAAALRAVVDGATTGDGEGA